VREVFEFGIVEVLEYLSSLIGESWKVIVDREPFLVGERLTKRAVRTDLRRRKADCVEVFSDDGMDSSGTSAESDVRSSAVATRIGSSF
jgi:hypothetical protein